MPSANRLWMPSIPDHSTVTLRRRASRARTLIPVVAISETTTFSMTASGFSMTTAAICHTEGAYRRIPMPRSTTPGARTLRACWRTLALTSLLVGSEPT